MRTLKSPVLALALLAPAAALTASGDPRCKGETAWRRHRNQGDKGVHPWRLRPRSRDGGVERQAVRRACGSVEV